MVSRGPSYSHFSIQTVVGDRAILEHQPELMAAAWPWGQADQVGDLEYFLERPTRLRTIPHLLLLRERSAPEPAASTEAWAGAIRGAVLVYTYAGPLCVLKLFLSSNRRGLRTVFAPAEARVEIAAMAVQRLMQQGARFVNLDFDLGPREPGLARPSPQWPFYLAIARLRLRTEKPAAYQWALREGIKRFDLELHPDYDQTVAVLGKHSRRNLRRYQRMCTRDLGAVFEPKVKIALAELLEMNPRCSYPVSEELARWRYQSLDRFPNTFLVGLRHRDGTWLSLLAGRRNHGVVAIDWQMNRLGFETFSLTTAMRSFLIEHEGSIGSTSLYPEGGTLHTIRASFRINTVYNLAAQKPSILLRALAWGLARFLPRKAAAEAMVRPGRVWQSSHAFVPANASRPHPE